jgi:hypothetical protein
VAVTTIESTVGKIEAAIGPLKQGHCECLHNLAAYVLNMIPGVDSINTLLHTEFSGECTIELL